MMRSCMKLNFSLLIVCSLTATSNLFAGDLGIILNGDMETESRFVPHGTPGVDNPNGYPDAWHHSANSSWSNGTTDPATSPTHSLYIPDNRVSDHDEMRSFATALPRVGEAGRILDLQWNWSWDITSAAGDMFSATVRVSKSPVGGLDLSGAITDYLFLTDGSASSGGFQPFSLNIPLAPDDASFDIIYRTRDNVGDSSETGVMFIDDVSSRIPEPTTLILICLSGLGLLSTGRLRI